jgi:hypothetical protein
MLRLCQPAAAALLTALLAAATPGLPPLQPLATAVAAGATDEAVLDQAFALFSPLAERRAAARVALVARDRIDAAPALILALRYARVEEDEINGALEALTRDKAGGDPTQSLWHRWMVWQERRPDVVPLAGFDRLVSAIVSRHDPSFASMLYPGIAHEIRLSEIAWGGVARDGIPALDNPRLIAAAEASYLMSDDPVFGIAIGGDVRAYPLRIMDWHEMLNDVVGGVPVSLAYCTLCGSAILFEGRVAGREQPFTFGSSGLLYRSNKLMYDRATRSLWNQFTGRPVAGPLTGSGIVLTTRPVAIASWGDWLAANPTTRVLAPETGFARDYTPGAAYGGYFASPDLMFPAAVDEALLKAKDQVFALRGLDREKAWPLALFAQMPVLNDTAGVVRLTLVGNPATRTVRAYRTAGEKFAPGPAANTLTLDGRLWRLTEEALVGPAGESYPRLPGHVAYWFAWSGYLGGRGEVAPPLR